MAITNFGELKSEVDTYLKRTDKSARVPVWTQIVTEQLNNGDNAIGLRPLRTRALLTSADVTITDGEGATPSDYLEASSLRYVASRGDALTLIAPDAWWGLAAAYEAGGPQFYTIEGTTLRVGPTASGTAKLQYHPRLATLSADADTNWVLTNAAGVYLFGVLAQAFGELVNDMRQSEYAAKFVGLANALTEQQERAQFSAGPLRALPVATD